MGDTDSELAALKTRVGKLEAQMDFLLRRLGVSTGEAPEWDASPKVVDLLIRGDRSAAIKAYMEETGAGLKDAKHAIDSMQP